LLSGNIEYGVKAVAFGIDPQMIKVAKRLSLRRDVRAVNLIYEIFHILRGNAENSLRQAVFGGSPCLLVRGQGCVCLRKLNLIRRFLCRIIFRIKRVDDALPCLRNISVERKRIGKKAHEQHRCKQRRRKQNFALPRFKIRCAQFSKRHFTGPSCTKPF